MCVCVSSDFYEAGCRLWGPPGSLMSQKSEMSFLCSTMLWKSIRKGEDRGKKTGILNGQFYIRVCGSTFVMCSACFIFFLLIFCCLFILCVCVVAGCV